MAEATASLPGKPRITGIQWVICAVAAIGFAFDIYAVLVLPLIVRPAVMAMGGIAPTGPAFAKLLNDWVALLFFIPALAGGVFGLLGGYLTDLFGRRRILVWSILLYTFSALAAGYATSLPMLLFLRCTTFIGVSVEFVAAVAWLAELFPDPKQRESVLGYTQAFSSLGGMMAAAANYLANTYHLSLFPIYGAHDPWRYVLLSGVIPAIPLMIIRPFLPESPMWQKQKAAGTLRRPSFGELFQPQYRKTTLITAWMYACSYGAAFGAIQHLPRIVPGLPEVIHLAVPRQQQIVSSVQGYQETGGLVGRIALALLVIPIVSRRKLLRVFQVPGMIIVPLVFFLPAKDNLEMLKWGVALAGFFTVAQFSFWGNYLPRVYPTHLRGTGESFAANIGGRMLGTSAALLTTQLANRLPGSSPPAQLANAAAAVALFVYVGGFVASFWLPDPKMEKLPD
jgi:MFS family permease